MAPFEYYLNSVKAAARSFAVEAIAAPVHDTSELESVIAAQTREPNGGLIVMPDNFMIARRVEVTSLAAHYRLPAVYNLRAFAEVGGLLSYGVNETDNFRRAATMPIASSKAEGVHRGRWHRCGVAGGGAGAAGRPSAAHRRAH
jgi:putative ABC transport system substrate-binding protein